MTASPVLQTQPTPGGPVAFLGTVALSWAFFTFTAQIAATYLLGDVPWRRAAIVGLVPAVTVAALINYPPAVILGITYLVEIAVMRTVYRVRIGRAIVLAAAHIVASIAIGVPLAYLASLLATAPL